LQVEKVVDRIFADDEGNNNIISGND
jgi:hypothetical protein